MFDAILFSSLIQWKLRISSIFILFIFDVIFDLWLYDYFSCFHSTRSLLNDEVERVKLMPIWLTQLYDEKAFETRLKAGKKSNSVDIQPRRAVHLFHVTQLMTNWWHTRESISKRTSWSDEKFVDVRTDEIELNWIERAGISIWSHIVCYLLTSYVE